MYALQAADATAPVNNGGQGQKRKAAGRPGGRRRRTSSGSHGFDTMATQTQGFIGFDALVAAGSTAAAQVWLALWTRVAKIMRSTWLDVC